MACELIGLNGANCITSDGGIKRSFLTDYENITGIVYDTAGQVTSVTMGSVGKWKEFVFDDDDTAYYNQAGTRKGNNHITAQKAFFKFGGLDNTKRSAALAIAQCCSLVAIHFLNSGKSVIQGIEQVGTTNQLETSKKKAKATVVKFDTDTGANEDRMEVELNSEAKSLSNFTTFTPAQVRAL